MTEKNIWKEAREIQEELVRWRRDLHRMPETGMALPNTSAYIQEQLDRMGVGYRLLCGGFCVTGVLGQGAPCILLRSDMDGLPVKEESGVLFASENGCMHACGHDMHAAILLGAIKLLKRHEQEWRGTVKFLFQPGEETFEGAKQAVEEGILEDPHVDCAFAMHVASPIPVGTMAYGNVPMAAVYGFKITLKGKGGHGSTPELCIDPINTGVHIYLALQELIARECPPSKEAALTIGQFQAGEVSNVIPEYAVMQGTLRTFDETVAERLIRRIRETAEGIAGAYRTEIRIDTLCRVPAVSCDPKMNERIGAALRRMDDTFHVVPAFHTMGSEDFAFLSQQVPSSYFSIGASVEDRKAVYPQHNPKVQFDERALADGAAAYVCAALEELDYRRKT